MTNKLYFNKNNIYMSKFFNLFNNIQTGMNNYSGDTFNGISIYPGDGKLINKRMAGVNQKLNPGSSRNLNMSMSTGRKNPSRQGRLVTEIKKNGLYAILYGENRLLPCVYGKLPTGTYVDFCTGDCDDCQSL
jgi:hypothetical protein